MVLEGLRDLTDAMLPCLDGAIALERLETSGTRQRLAATFWPIHLRMFLTADQRSKAMPWWSSTVGEKQLPQASRRTLL
jgi:hypothetical protein